jgi:thymidylate synthase (FAD)
MSDPRVELLAYTMLTPQAEGILSVQEGVEDADHLAELTGRDCYQSHDRPNPLTASTDDYIRKNLIDKHHFSVLEHATATFRFTGVSRTFTHELVRHRHLSFSQLSQRYVDIADMQMVVPPLIREWPDDAERKEMLQLLDSSWALAEDYYNKLEQLFISRKGVTRKQAREAARCVLPGGTDTIIDVTGNHRAWREVLQKRLSPQADAEIREVMEAVLSQLLNIAPSTYADFV